MSQQINLLPNEKIGFSPLMLALVVWAVVALGVLATWGFNQFRLVSVQEKLAAAETDLKQAQAALQQRTDTRAALLAEIEAVQPLAAAAKDLLGKVGEVGNTTGFSGYFSTLADATEEGLWLTRADLAQTRIRQVEGQSLNSEAVMRFGRNLNTLFSGQGMQFTTVELTPQTTTIAPTDGRLPIGSTKFVVR